MARTLLQWITKDNRLDGTPNPVSQYAYTVNPLGQRDKVETVGTAFGTAPVWNWSYNPRGELVSAKDTSINNRNFGYIYDAIGNRLATGSVYSITAGIEQVTNPLAYTPNALNQYTVAKGVTLPTTPAPAPYDLDGNLRFDGGVNKDNEAREYLWDAENRLINVKRASDGATLVTYAYDSQSRCISRSAGVSPTTTWYLYDGWNVIAEYTGSTPALARTQTWGIDLSGTLQGAGGVGGLLAVRTGGVNYFTTYDGNGNVSEYLTSSGVVAAHFEYDPFGNTIIDTDTNNQFTYRFSTKPIDLVTGWFYYLYRWYDAPNGRWPSRDPIEEEGGVNLYGFVENDGVNKNDAFGLFSWEDLAFTSVGRDIAGNIPPSNKGIPIGLGGGRLQVTWYFTGSYFGCCNSSTGQREHWFQATFGLEAYVIWGYSGKTPGWSGKGRDRNKRGQDGSKNKDNLPTNKPPEGFRERKWHADFSGISECPKKSLTGSLYIFVRGSAGAGFIGGQFNLQRTWTFLDDSTGSDIDFSVHAATGIYGASVEVGGGGSLSIQAKVPVLN